jgi:C4-type Zn-finger protein
MIYPIESEKDGRTKVVRSREGIVIIPELAIRIEPTGDGTTWIRNIEGILEDIQQKLSISLAYSETEEERNTVKARIELVEQLKEYSQPFTIEVEDPSGNSIILPVDETKLQIIELPVDE